MKNEQLIYDALKILSYSEETKVSDILRRFLQTNKPSITGKFDMYKYVGADIMRPWTTGIYYNDGFIVATDARLLVCLSGAVYDPEKEGKIINKEGAVIDGNYPKWKNVVPMIEQMTSTWTIDRAKIADVVNAGKIRKKENRYSDEYYIKINGVCFDSKLLLKLADFSEYIGVNSLNLAGPEKSAVIYAGESVGLLFPNIPRRGVEEGVINFTPEWK